MNPKDVDEGSGRSKRGDANRSDMHDEEFYRKMTDMRCGSDDTFPAPVFKDTVLGPLFESAKANFVDAFRRIDRAHCVMLAEAGILTPAQASSMGTSTTTSKLIGEW